jgi:hypothetical protein
MPRRTGVAQALEVLHERVRDDRAVAEAVLFLAGDSDGPVDPFADPGGGVRAAAGALNAQRQRSAREGAGRDALDTAAVVELIGSINDRKGVDRRRRRGQLLGWRSGARTLHPAWQFDPARTDTRAGLPDVLEALADVAADAQQADALMRAPRDDLDGRSLADLFASGKIDTVVRLVRGAGDQS